MAEQKPAKDGRGMSKYERKQQARNRYLDVTFTGTDGKEHYRHTYSGWLVGRHDGSIKVDNI